MRPPDTRRQTVLSIVFAALLVSSVVASPALADESGGEESFFDGLVDSETAVGLGQQAASVVAEATSWAARTKAKVFNDNAGNATKYASEFTDSFNEQNETIQSYANARLDATADYDVFAVHFHDRSEGNVTRYVVADVSNGNYSNTRAVSELPMNRGVDHHVSLDWYQSKHASDELESFVDDYAAKEKDVSAGYRAKMLAKYGAPDSSLWNNTTTES